MQSTQQEKISSTKFIGDTLDSLDIGSWEWHLKTNEVQWSENMASFFGLKSIDGQLSTTREHCLSYVHRDDIERVRSDFDRCIKTRSRLKIEYRVVKPNAQIQWVQSRGYVKLSAEGRPTCMLGVMLDITTRKENEYKLKKDHELTEEKNEMKSKFLLRLSHEIKTPLNAIIGFSQLLLEDEDLNAEHQAILQKIMNAGTHIDGLVDDSLEISQIESGRVAMQAADYPLHELLTECCDIMMITALEHEQSIQLDIVAASNLYVHVDRKRFIQVILNLLSNAIKYNVPQGKVRIHCSQGTSKVLIGVEDTGIGLTSEQQDKLFQPFQRLGAEASTVQGTGIGLVITRQLVELMRGTIFVSSQAGKGTTFYIELPTDTIPG